jgi:hypothetical protein
MQADAPGPVTHLSRIALRAFVPGAYELRVTVTDRSGGATAARSAPFVIE